MTQMNFLFEFYESWKTRFSAFILWYVANLKASLYII